MRELSKRLYFCLFRLEPCSFRPNLALQQKTQHVPFIFSKNPVVDLNRPTLLQYLSWAQLNFVVAAVHVMLWLPIMCFSDLANYTTQCPMVGLVRLLTWYPSAAPPCRFLLQPSLWRECSQTCSEKLKQPLQSFRLLFLKVQRTETELMHFNIKTRRQEKRKSGI